MAEFDPINRPYLTVKEVRDATKEPSGGGPAKGVALLIVAAALVLSVAVYSWANRGSLDDDFVVSCRHTHPAQVCEEAADRFHRFCTARATPGHSPHRAANPDEYMACMNAKIGDLRGRGTLPQ